MYKDEEKQSSGVERKYNEGDLELRERSFVDIICGILVVLFPFFFVGSQQS